MSVDLLLSRLDKVRPTGKGRWIACCPAHGDKHPSLTITETDDGKTLVKCFTGCSVYEIVSAVGLELSDLFPPRDTNYGKPERRPFPAADVLRAIAFEALVVASSGAALLSGAPFSDTDRERLMLAVGRIQSALDAAFPQFREKQNG